MRNFLLGIIAFIFFLPFYAIGSESEFVPMVGIPGIDKPADLTLDNYVTALYILSISVAAFLAVMRLIYAGVQYILSDIVTSKENAKKDIKNSIIGLLIVLGAVVVLNTINPQLRDLNALGKLEPSRNTLLAITVPERKLDDEGVLTGRNLDTTDLRGMTPEEIRVEAKKCEDAGGRFVTRGSIMAGECQGNVSENASTNIINTQTSMEEYLATTAMSTQEKQQFSQRYNQFVGSQEPENLDEQALEKIMNDWGADEVVFIVTHDPLNTSTANSLVGYEATQEQICRDMTGSENFVVGDNYAACLK